jgi:hypothetical protein
MKPPWGVQCVQKYSADQAIASVESRYAGRAAPAVAAPVLRRIHVASRTFSRLRAASCSAPSRIAKARALRSAICGDRGPRSRPSPAPRRSLRFGHAPCSFGELRAGGSPPPAPLARGKAKGSKREKKGRLWSSQGDARPAFAREGASASRARLPHEILPTSLSFFLSLHSPRGARGRPAPRLRDRDRARRVTAAGRPSGPGRARRRGAAAPQGRAPWPCGRARCTSPRTPGTRCARRRSRESGDPWRKPHGTQARNPRRDHLRRPPRRPKW